MTFLFPAGLWALLAVPAVILLHLRRRRRRVQPVASLEIWREVVAALQSEGRFSRFRLDPLLLLEVAIAGALSLAAAGPLWTAGRSTAPRLRILLDVSGSMGARLEDGREAAGAAREAVRALWDEGPWFAFILSSSPGDQTLEIGPDDGWDEVEDWLLRVQASRAADPFEADPALGRWLEAGAADHLAVVTDRPRPSGLGEAVRWIQVAEGAGWNVGWVRVASEPRHQGHAAVLAVAEATEIPAAGSLRLVVRAPGGEPLFEGPLEFAGSTRVEVVFEEPAGVQSAVLGIVRPDGAPVGDALEADDTVELARVPPVTIGLADGSLDAVARAVESWGELGVLFARPGGPAPDLVFLASPGEPESWSAAKAVLLPGCDARGVRFGEAVEGGWIDRVIETPLLSGVPLGEIEVPLANRPLSLPEGSRALAWAGATPILWETPRGDLAIALPLFARVEPAPPAAVPLLLHALVESIRPGAGRLAPARTLAPAEIAVARRRAPPVPPATAGPVSTEAIDLTGWLAGLGLGLLLLHGLRRSKAAWRYNRRS